jgi:hypothetical protein
MQSNPSSFVLSLSKHRFSSEAVTIEERHFDKLSANGRKNSG